MPKYDEYTQAEIEQLDRWENTEQWLERTEETGSIFQTREAHPSFGMIGISRTSGNASLFESEIRHQYYLSIRIKEAVRLIDGTHTHIHGGKELIEINLTEAQFATLMTQPNHGDGVPCTIHYSIADKNEPWTHPRFMSRPYPPAPERFEKKFHKEAGERAKIISDNLADLEKEIDSFLSGDLKANKGTLNILKAKVSSARQQIDQNIPYVLHTAEEQLEKKISAAVIEFEGYINQSLQQKGLALAQGTSSPQLYLSPSPKE
jgi:hypothetical protein